MHFSDIPMFVKLISLTFFALFPVINPIGTSFIIHAMNRNVGHAEYRTLAFKIATYTVGFLAIFLLLGPYILKLFGLSIPSVQVGGGLVLMMIGWKALNNDDQPDAEKSAAAVGITNSKGKEFYPFTFPITAGPGGISVILTLSAHSSKGFLHSQVLNYAATFVGIAAMGIVVYFCYLYLPRITTRLSKSGLIALTKLLAFVILCIGVEIMWNGIHAFVSN